VWPSPQPPFDLGAARTPRGPPAVSPDACVPPPRLCLHSVDWYMVAQKALKGTARPTHYHILQADFGTPAELQQLTFDLCHVAGVATKVVGRPAPVYYAKRAALLARYYEGGRREEGAGPASDNVSEAGTATTLGGNVQKDGRFALGVNIRNTVYFA